MPPIKIFVFLDLGKNSSFLNKHLIKSIGQPGFISTEALYFIVHSEILPPISGRARSKKLDLFFLSSSSFVSFVVN